MINLKDKKINNVYLGNKKINKVYLGNKKVFEIGNILPSEYKEVEYIESTGTQYIDTNYIINSKTNKIEIVFQMVNVDNEFNCVFGYEKVSNNRFFMRYNQNNTNYFGCYTPNSSAHVMNSSNKNQIIFDIPNDKLYKNGNEENVTITINTSGLNLYLFGLNYNDSFATNNASNMRLFSFKIYENDKIVKEYIPCYRKSDNEIGMYDLVNDVFYTNAGTGTFNKGGDV